MFTILLESSFINGLGSIAPVSVGVCWRSEAANGSADHQVIIKIFNGQHLYVQQVK